MFAKSLGKSKKSIEIFRKNIKNLQGMFKKSAPGTGGFLTRKPSPSGDNVEISSGPIQPGEVLILLEMVMVLLVNWF